MVLILILFQIFGAQHGKKIYEKFKVAAFVHFIDKENNFFGGFFTFDIHSNGIYIP